MIVKGSQRSGGRNLANHLLNDVENDHVEVGELRGLPPDSLHAALHTIEMTAAGTKASKPFFSVSFNPPAETHFVSNRQFERAFEAVERLHGLEDQPRAVVFHEKNGRRHAHVVWSIIDNDQMKAVKLGMYKNKLQDVSRQMYKELGIQMPKGLENKKESDPLNFDRGAWQQATRIGEDPRDLKQIIGEAFRYSDGAKAFSARLEENALMLARGDRRGFVVVHHSGEVLPLHRYLGVKLKDTKSRLGDPAHHVTVDQAKSQLRARMTAQAEAKIKSLKKTHGQEWEPMAQAILQLRAEHREARKTLCTAQEDRKAREAHIRGERLRKGIAGLWQRFTGERGRVVRRNAQEAQKSRDRDQKEKDSLLANQIKERGQLQKSIAHLREKHRQERRSARSVLGHWLSMDRESVRSGVQEHAEELSSRKEAWREASSKSVRRAERLKKMEQGRDGRDKGHDRDGPKI